jgi:hypothetical protein
MAYTVDVIKLKIYYVDGTTGKVASITVTAFPKPQLRR